MSNTSCAVKRLVIIGVGLIGGSFALDLKRAKRVDKVVGVDRSAHNLLRAQQLGVIDVIMPLENAVKEADVIFVATPVGQMASVFSTLAKWANPQAIITDAGSTKAEVAALYQAHLQDRLAYCLPAHPIAGAEQSGATAARYGLYQQRKVVLCPFLETAQHTIEVVQSLWIACGAENCFLDVQTHDQILSLVSHLPHLVAFSYMNMLGRQPDSTRCLQFASTGFKDFSRIAGSHPEMWRDIALGNKEALLQGIRAYQDTLQTLYTALEQHDETILLDFIAQAQYTRKVWENNQLK